MKKVFLFSLISILIAGCVNDDNKIYPVDASRRIFNETNHDLNIQIYDNSTDTFQFNLAPQSTFIIEADCIDTPFDDIYFCKIGWDVSQYANIIFNNERIQRFELDENLECTGKAINGDFWSSDCGYEYDYQYNQLVTEYRITQEDYENAEIL
jgi:hypothetical protein